jgi:hypothetical protein
MANACACSRESHSKTSIRMRSPTPTARESGPSEKALRRRTASSSSTPARAGAARVRRQGEPQRRRAPRRVGDLDPLRAPPDLARPLLRTLRSRARPLACELVAVARAARDPRGAGGGAAAHLALDGDEVVAPGDGLVVGLLRPSPGVGALAFVGFRAAGVMRRRAGARVELDELVHRVGQQPAVVGDQDHTTGPGAQQRGQPLQAIVVEVVGGLIEQHTSKRAACRAARPARAAWPRESSSSGRSRSAGSSPASATAPPTRASTSAQGQPALQRDGVRLEGLEIPGGQAPLQRLDRARRPEHADAVEDRRPHRLRTGGDLG